MLDHIDHIDVRVPSLSDAEAFLGDLGFLVRRRHAEPRTSIEMGLPGEVMFFELREDPSLTTGVIDHVAFATADIQAVADALLSAGRATPTEPRLVGATGRTVSNFASPLGFKWQLTDTADA